MNKHKYLQMDGRWGGLPYPKAPWYLRNCGCGCCAVLHGIIEIPKFKNYTPATIQPYMKQFAEAKGNGTYHYGIPTALKHYGCTDVKEHPNLNSLWKELSKGTNYIVVYLMGSKNGGTKKVHWTGSGHFVESCDYHKKDGKHYVYMKDSASNSSLRNGQISYEENFRGSVLKVWSGRLPERVTTKTYPGALLVDGVGGFATIQATQKFFGVNQNGAIINQDPKQKQFYPSITAVDFQKKKKLQGNDPTVIALQKWVGVKELDGIIGKGTVAAWQKKLKDAKYYTGIIDGYFGAMSMIAWQEFLNDKLDPNAGKKEETSNSKTENSPGGNSEKKSETTTKKKKTMFDKANDWCVKMAKDGTYGYVTWSDKDVKTHQCPICHKLTGKYKGFNCIRYAFSAWKHGAAIKCKCSGTIVSNATWEKILAASSDAKALKLAQDATGVEDLKVIRNGGKNIPKNKLKKGDICAIWSNGKYQHVYYYMGSGKLSDCSNRNSSGMKGDIKANVDFDGRYKNVKVVLRYTGKGSK